MIDGHIHLEYGDYTLEYIQKFVDKAGGGLLIRNMC